MSKIKKLLCKSRRGMSLIEILIVVAMIAIISAAVLPRFGTYTENSRYATAESDLDSIMTAVSATYSQVGTFGSVSSGDLSTAFNSSDFKETFETMFGRDIDDISDPWGNPYQIVATNFNETTGRGTLKVQCQINGTARTNPNNKDRTMERIIFSFTN